MQVLTEPAPADTPPVRSRDALLQAFAVILADDRAAYLSFTPDEAVMASKTPDIFAIGENIEPKEWVNLSPLERAERVFAWVEKAAEYYRKPEVRFDSLRKESEAA